MERVKSRKNPNGRPADERRSATRYPLNQQLWYKLLDSRSGVQPGEGITLDMSSAGVLFRSEKDLPAGKRVELAIEWPASLEGGCPLKLVATGHIVRAEEGRVAVRIERYEFRTRGTGDLRRANGHADT